MCADTFALKGMGHGARYLLPQPGELPGVHRAMDKLAKTYGPIMGFYFGSKYTVVVSDHKYAVGAGYPSRSF